MVRFRSTALARKALSDVRSTGSTCALLAGSDAARADADGGGCAGLSPRPAEIAAEDNDAQFSQAMRMAESVRASGDMSAAAVFYRRAHSLAPDQLEPIIGLAQSAAAVGAKEQALQFYRKAVVLAPDNIQARLGLGRVLLAMERPDLAAPELRAAIAAQPGDYRAYVALGVALDLSCEQRQAQQVYREGLLHDSGNMSLRNNLALSLAFSGDTGEAIGHAVGAVARTGGGSPGSPKSRSRLQPCRPSARRGGARAARLLGGALAAQPGALRIPAWRGRTEARRRRGVRQRRRGR